ncbi:MAG: nucleotidyltransferase [Eubacterium sp.]|nr:nucleotidyltransferase [Eubacterium sp.]
MKKEPVLVVMAAGMGSRFGGLKQVTTVDEMGHALMDYAIYDAYRGGFRKVVFIIRKSFEEEFKLKIGNRIAKKMKVSYVFQELSQLPEGVEIPEGREKPWGTTHALFCCKDELEGHPFLTVNADDYYGVEAFKIAYDFLSSEDGDDKHAIIGYDAVRTLSEFGNVSRGICQCDDQGNLIRIDERKEIKLEDGVGYYTLDGGETWNAIPEKATASMNMWAFNPGFLRDLAGCFQERLKKGIEANPLKFEETISDAVQNMMERGKGSVVVLPTTSKWFGMTYQEDIASVTDALRVLMDAGVYPEKDW